MTKDDVLFGYRQQLFAEAARTSVSQACRTFGVHRSTYYAWKRQVDRHGLEMLRPREHRRPQMPNQMPKMIEERIVSFSIALRELRAAARERDPEVRSGVIRQGARRKPTEVSRYIDEHRGRFGVEPICRVLDVSASAYYQRATGIQGAKRRGKPWRTTIANPAAHRAPDLVQRDFTASQPDELWVADFTYLRCWEGLVFFSFVIDVYSRRVVGWQFAAHMRTDLVLDGLRWPSRAARPAPICSSCITPMPAVNIRRSRSRRSSTITVSWP
jgi:transposase-like protein